MKLSYLETMSYELIKENGRKITSREELLKKIWETDFYGSIRVVDDTIRRVRKKTKDTKILSVYGKGYIYWEEK